LRHAIVDFWKAWRKTPGNQEWRALTFFLDGKRFKVDLGYPGEIRDEEDTLARRRRVLARYFPGQQVDYSASSI
jgi:hypothetical protein